ncbi:MAG: YcaO-like family protein [Burkholderiales bacterium]|nr:YcaO-like family protein [Burkholderiales bacterium]
MRVKFRLGDLLEAVGDTDQLQLAAEDPLKTLETCTRASKLAGVSRLTDLTLLDCLGMDTWQAVRPLSRNLVVSQGKGGNPIAAKISALAEAIELSCAEEPAWDSWASPIDAASKLTYEYAQLPGLRDVSGEFWGIPRRWTRAYDLAVGEWSFIPTELVCIDFTSKVLDPPSFRVTSNGLASGDTVEQAVLHGLLEVIERDAIGRAQDGLAPRIPVRFQPEDLSEPCRSILQRIGDMGGFVEASYIRSSIGLPAFEARIVGDDGRVFFGTAAHFQPVAGLVAAIYEAAQSRLTAISGARDDISDQTYLPRGGNRTVKAAFRARRPMASGAKRIEEIDGLKVGGKREAIARCTELLKEARYTCLVADIGSVASDFHVAFVVIPKMQRTRGHS